MTYVNKVPRAGVGLTQAQREAQEMWQGAIQRAINDPEKAVLVAEKMPRSRIMSGRGIVGRFNRSLDKGKVVVNQRNTSRDEDGKMFADVYFSYEEDD